MLLHMRSDTQTRWLPPDLVGFPVLEDERNFGAYRGNIRNTNQHLYLEPFAKQARGAARKQHFKSSGWRALRVGSLARLVVPWTASSVWKGVLDDTVNVFGRLVAHVSSRFDGVSRAVAVRLFACSGVGFVG